MLKFFRRIRQTLLTDLPERPPDQIRAGTRSVRAVNRVNKYLLYAIGEILLVVVGILIALEVNNWNNNRSNQKEEEIHRQAISEKMKLNQFQYEVGIKRHKGVMIAAEELLTLMSDSSTHMSKSTIEQNLYKLTKRFLMGKSNATSIYDELIGAGQLSNISSQELRNQLTNLKANMQLLESYEELQTQFVDNHLSPFLNKHIDRIPIGTSGSKTDSTVYGKSEKLIYGNSAKINYSVFNKNALDQSYEEFLKSREFSNLLLELMYHTQTLLPIYDRIGVNISIIDSIAMDANESI